MKCPQCGHDTLMQQEQDGALYLCGFCGFRQYRCPKCGSEMEPTDAMSYDVPPATWWVCTNLNCGHEEKVKP